MRRKFIYILIFSLFCLSILVLSAPVSGDPGVVGARIPHEEKGDLAHLNPAVTTFIDYGSFLWIVTTPQVLADLESSGINFQSVENPYLLTLGGQTFDPLESSPIFSQAWEGVPQKEGPGLHLVQCQGPIKPEWLESLNGDGFEVLQYIHPFTYVVWGDLTSRDRSAAKDFVRWTGDYLPAYAVQPKNRSLSEIRIAVRIMIYPAAGLTETIQKIEALGGTLTGIASGVDPVFDLAGFILPGDQLQAVASQPGVYAVQPVPTDGGDRGEMSNQVNADNLDSSNRAFTGYLNWLSQIGLSGQGVVIANVDSGINQNHPDLINRMTACVGSTCGGLAASNHGTHTAGIMVGDGASGVKDGYGFLRGLGMAPGANLIEQVYTPTSQQEYGMLTLMTQSYRNNAVISGNSWGPSDDPLGYDIDTRLVDIGVRDADPDQPGNQPLSYILSIMNGFGGTSTQGTPDEAKNVFTIGSTKMQTAAGAQNLNINDLSANTAHGPALDGRQIPHLVAPGCYVDSTLLGASYGLACGTSMASPQVTGAAALFYEKYRNLYGVFPSPALLKAAFLPVAHDLAGFLDADGSLLGHPFDSKQGWGRLNAAAVLKPSMQVAYFDQVELLTATGQTWSVAIPAEFPVRQLRAMLVWTDAPGHGLEGSTPAWNNNLDLTFSDGKNTYFGNYFDTAGFSIPGGTPDVKNNTEGIFLSDLPSGSYTLTVTASNLTSDGVPNNGMAIDQDFALVFYIVYDNLTNHYIFPIFFH